MGLKKLFEVLKKSKEYRKDWYIKWKIRWKFDTDDYLFMFLPTIVWLPWPYRHCGESIVCIHWFNFNLGIGEWRRRDD